MNAKLVFTQNEVDAVCEALLNQLGTVTTLQVKRLLREAGYYAIQADVSDAVQEWALNTGRVWNDVENQAGDGTVHRVYRDRDVPGQPPKSIHAQPLPAQSFPVVITKQRAARTQDDQSLDYFMDVLDGALNNLMGVLDYVVDDLGEEDGITEIKFE